MFLSLCREPLQHRKVKFPKAQHFEGMLQKENQFASQGFDESVLIESHLHTLNDTHQRPDPKYRMFKQTCNSEIP